MLNKSHKHNPISISSNLIFLHCKEWISSGHTPELWFLGSGMMAESLAIAILMVSAAWLPIL